MGGLLKITAEIYKIKWNDVKSNKKLGKEGKSLCTLFDKEMLY